MSDIKFENKEVHFSCTKHGSMVAKIFNIGNGWSDPICSFCDKEKRDEEDKREKKRKAREKAADSSRIMSARLVIAAIPKRFQEHSFDTFEAKTPDQTAKKDACIEFANTFDKASDRGTSLIFCGDTGTGKTHLACSIANHIIKEKNCSAIFVSVIKAIRTVKSTYSKNSDLTEQQAIDWFTTPDLLILDEVGVQFGSDAEKLILFEILNERYENMKPTILISNLTPKALREFVGDRVIDRFRENDGSVLQFLWDSHRAGEQQT